MAVKGSNLRIYTLHNYPRVLLKLASFQESNDCAGKCFFNFVLLIENDLGAKFKSGNPKFAPFHRKMGAICIKLSFFSSSSFRSGGEGCVGLIKFLRVL